MKNQSGLTLVEVLAAITLAAIIGVIVINTFIQGSDFSRQALSTNQLNQESNIVVSSLKGVHQTNAMYEVTAIDCKIKIETENKTITFSNENICFQLTYQGENQSLEEKMQFNPKTEEHHNLSFELTLFDREYEDKKIVIPVNLYRLREVT